MAVQTDASIGFGVESVYGTGVTPTVWVEQLPGESLDYEVTKTQGKGLRVGGSVPRSARRVITKYSGGGKFDVEVTTKGLGKLWRAALGTGASTLVSGTTYQQNYTLGTATPASLTIQKGVVNTAGTVQAYTFAGCLCDSWEVKAAAGDIAIASFTWDAQSMTTATAYTAPSYVASPNLFHFAQGAITIGGTVTAPTTTALATGGTSVANVTEFSIQGSNGLMADRYAFGAAGLKMAPVLGQRKVSGKLTAELSDTTLRDAMLADTPLALVLTFTSGETLSTGTAQFQIVCSEVKFSGSLPSADGELATLSLDFDVLDNLTAAQPLYVIHRTADSAI